MSRIVKRASGTWAGRRGSFTDMQAPAAAIRTFLDNTRLQPTYTGLVIFILVYHTPILTLSSAQTPRYRIGTHARVGERDGKRKSCEAAWVREGM
jgi:hypothetical protein